MQTEYEAKFYPVKKDMITKKLQSCGAQLVQPEVTTVIAVFNMQTNPHIQADYIRVRDEGTEVRLSAKIHAAQDGSVSDQKEADTIVEDFGTTVQILEYAGLVRSGNQEKKRETWKLDNAEVVIDTWPGLETYIEIEATSETVVMHVAELLGFEWKDRIITSVVEIYMKKYNLSAPEVLELMKHVTFTDNPFEQLGHK